MIKVFICEDNIKQKEYLEKIVSKIIFIEDYDMQLGIATDNPYDILDEIQNSNFTGIYFLDVDLGTNINGIQLAEEIRKYDPRGFIIFITTHAEMSYLTFRYKVEAMDYIIKDNYKNVENKIRECIEKAYVRYIAKVNDVQKNFSIKSDNRVISVDYNNILFFETSSTIHKIIMYCENRQIEFYGQMTKLMDKLDERFIRCHTSYIINKNKIAEVDKKNRIVYMINGQKCLASVRGIKNII